MISKLYNVPLMKCTIWEIITPDEKQELIGYRWIAESSSWTVISETIYVSEKGAKIGLRYASNRLSFTFKTVHYDIRTNTEFLA